MAVFVRTKRVTDPLDDKVKACLCGRDHRITGYASSGSEHDAESSVFLSDLIHGFLEDGDGSHQADNRDDYDEDDDGLDPTDMIKELLNPTPQDPFRVALLAQVSKAVDAFSGFVSQRSVFRRAVMSFLREYGNNAGVCKTKWETSGGLTGGNYEFIDVIRSDGQRYIVDVGFAGEFEIARPTKRYGLLLQALPRIYVGRPEELKQIVRIASDAAKRSMHSRGLFLPPWRKRRYMQAKWMGPYKRTFNQTANRADCERFAVKCRSVGFDSVPEKTAVGNCRLITPLATQT